MLPQKSKSNFQFSVEPEKLPWDNFAKSSRSFMRPNKVFAAVLSMTNMPKTTSETSFCWMRSETPMIQLRGVRNSWDIFATVKFQRKFEENSLIAFPKNYVNFEWRKTKRKFPWYFHENSPKVSFSFVNLIASSLAETSIASLITCHLSILTHVSCHYWHVSWRHHLIRDIFSQA